MWWWREHTHTSWTLRLLLSLNIDNSFLNKCMLYRHINVLLASYLLKIKVWLKQPNINWILFMLMLFYLCSSESRKTNQLCSISRCDSDSLLNEVCPMFPWFQERLFFLCIISLYSQFSYELNGALNWWWPFYYDTSQWNFLFDVVMISIWLLIVDQRSWTKVWYPILQFFKYMDSSIWVLFPCQHFITEAWVLSHDSILLPHCLTNTGLYYL